MKNKKLAPGILSIQFLVLMSYSSIAMLTLLSLCFEHLGGSTDSRKRDESETPDKAKFFPLIQTSYSFILCFLYGLAKFPLGDSSV